MHEACLFKGIPGPTSLNTHPDVVHRCNQMKTKYMYTHFS